MAVDIEVGETIPPVTPHAVSVSLPTWRANVGYEEGEQWVVGKMKTGYPRFFIHKTIQSFASAILKEFGKVSDNAMLFPSPASAKRARDFVLQYATGLDTEEVYSVDLVPCPGHEFKHGDTKMAPRTTALLFPESVFKVAKQFWQHTGEGISSRRAEYCHALFNEGLMVPKAQADILNRTCKGPRRYQRNTSFDLTLKNNGVNGRSEAVNGRAETQDSEKFVEERFGRNLGMSFASSAKTAIRRRIAGTLTEDVELNEALHVARDEARTRQVHGFSEEDVYLYPAGMNAIYNTHRSMMVAYGEKKSISYGFPYVDTLKLLEKFGPGCIFYGQGDDHDLDDLERRCRDGERYLALFCEFPGNPLLKTPDLERIRALADKFDFMVVVDETIGNFLNINVLPLADVVVSSLTKIFSGDCNVMGGSAILNPTGRNYDVLKQTWDQEYVDEMWSEDAVVLERNSRDFVSRIERINVNAEAVCDLLHAHSRIKQVNYPKLSSTRRFYDRCRLPTGGYGGLLSATFYSTADAIAFYDHLDTAKGPSLGTNFTLSSPFVILAHYGELDWAASFGVEANLVRFSVGLEETADLVSTFQRALNAILDQDGQ